MPKRAAHTIRTFRSMNSSPVQTSRLHATIEEWRLREPFRITGHVWHVLRVLRVFAEMDGYVGEGEAAGVYFRGETASSMFKSFETLRAATSERIDRTLVQTLLPPGGVRNALDCALWDLEAKVTGHPVWELLGLQTPRALLTTFGCGADTPEKMASVARSYSQARAIKLKLTGDPVDADRVLAVREVQADAWLGVDANQGFTRPKLEQLLPTLLKSNVSLIEQPFMVGEEALLDGFDSPIPIAADESAQTLSDIPRLAGRFDVVNIKLDKSGGLSEAFAAARLAHASGLETMIGNMIGTSLAMAPAFLVGQLCSVVDLDGPIFLTADRAIPASYS